MPEHEEEKFASYLQNIAGIAARLIPHYMRWVSAYRGSDASAQSDRQTALLLFRKRLSLRCQEWQVNQALRAVKHYWFWQDRHNRREGTGQNGSYKAMELLVEARRLIRLQHKSFRTEQTYLGWMRRFLSYTKKDPLSEIGPSDLRNYLSFLAVERRVSAATQQQAFNALLFLYRYLLNKQVDGLFETIRARRPQHLPVVLTPAEIHSLIDRLEEPYNLMASIIYAAGLRLRECLKLRIPDLDFERQLIIVRSGKGAKARITLFPPCIHERMHQHLKKVRRRFDSYRRENLPGVPLPFGLERKYRNASFEWAWYWVFPSARLSVDPRSSRTYRYHLYPTTLQKHLHQAAKRLGIMPIMADTA